MRYFTFSRIFNCSSSSQLFLTVHPSPTPHPPFPAPPTIHEPHLYPAHLYPILTPHFPLSILLHSFLLQTVMYIVKEDEKLPKTLSDIGDEGELWIGRWWQLQQRRYAVTPLLVPSSLTPLTLPSQLYCVTLIALPFTFILPPHLFIAYYIFHLPSHFYLHLPS
jgi:hypothetical protein